MQSLGVGAVPLQLYPWRWAKDDSDSFRALQNSGGNPARIFVAPILQELILNRNPQEVIDWVNQICKWKFNRVIPSHLENDIKATPSDVRRAFSFLQVAPPILSVLEPPAPGAKREDLSLLSGASGLLTDLGVVDPPGDKVPRRVL